MMKKGIIGGISLAIIIVVTIICFIICSEWIPDGYEGVVITMAHGAEDKTLNRGLHFISPTKKVKLFNISNEQLVLTKDKREGSKDDDSFRVSTSDDATIAISFQMSYRFDPDSVVQTYKKFRGMDGQDIVNNRVRTVMKSKVSEVTTSHSLMDIYSGNREAINNEIADHLNKAFSKDYGIQVLNATIIDVHPDKQLRKTINNRVAALQKKQQAQAEQETAKVEAATALIKAQNKADIKITEAKAEAEANRLKASSITPELIAMKEAEARLKHGWVTTTGVEAVVKEK